MKNNVTNEIQNVTTNLSSDLDNSFYYKHRFFTFFLFLLSPVGLLLPFFGIIIWFIIGRKNFIQNSSQGIRNTISFILSFFITASVFITLGIFLLILFGCTVNLNYYLQKILIGGLSFLLLMVSSKTLRTNYRYNNKIFNVIKPFEVYDSYSNPERFKTIGSSKDNRI